MLTRLSADNPYSPSRYAFAWEHVDAGASAHLDFGCYTGRLLEALHAKGVGGLVGADVSREAIAEARERLGDHARLDHIEADAPLPYADDRFDSITLLDVLEHVHLQRFLLRELYRVIRPGGKLIVTVPGRHLLSCLDLGNIKFALPRLHRWYVIGRIGRAAYRERFEANADGLIGDISAKKSWHEHFSPTYLGYLLRAAGFEPVLWDGTGFLSRLLTPLRSAVKPVPPVRRAVEYVQLRDAESFRHTNLFCLART
jgi:SAM-dependent methyltransferase